MNLRDKCNLWLSAAKEENISDETFDFLSYQLAKSYDKLPKWFKDKVPQENLKCGTTLGLEMKNGN